MKLPPSKPAILDDLQIEYEKFFTVSIDMLCISSYDGHFKKVNPAFEEVLGFSSDELCSKSYLDFIHPDDIEPTIKEVEKQLLTKQQVLSFENRYRCKDGSYKWLSWKSAPVGDFMYAAARDTTDNKRTNEDLKKAKETLESVNQELEAFSYSVAHDLRAPTRSIAGFGALILEDSESSLGTESKAHLNRIIAAGKKMESLIDGLLNLSRLTKENLVKEPVNLSVLGQEVASELASSTPGRKVDFTIAKNIVVDGDAVLLKAVIANLIENAWKYSSKLSRQVTIEFGSVEKDGQRVLFVRDDGIGFNMKYANKLFCVFQRLHSEQEFEGTGIGLVTVQRIIQRHGGKIWVTAGVDQGATFYFTL